MSGPLLAVLGSPISHSRSPLLHRAAYTALGLDWEYAAIEVPAGGLSAFIASRDDRWHGLSLTMPLKREAMPLLASADSVSELTGAANTVLFDRTHGLALRGFNTDVYGIVQAFAGVGLTELGYVQLLGAGATASSVIVAVAQLGAKRVVVSARTPERATPLVTLGERLGIEVAVRTWGVQDRSLIAPDAVVSTLPGGAPLDLLFAESIRQRSVLFDVAYDPWPGPLAASWLEVGGRVIPGLEMLLHQAVAQVRIFTGGTPEVPLDSEPDVVAAMRAALGL